VPRPIDDDNGRSRAFEDSGQGTAPVRQQAEPMADRKAAGKVRPQQPGKLGGRLLQLLRSLLRALHDKEEEALGRRPDRHSHAEAQIIADSKGMKIGPADLREVLALIDDMRNTNRHLGNVSGPGVGRRMAFLELANESRIISLVDEEKLRGRAALVALHVDASLRHQ
jgi:hypothetical protein